ncbi:amino acid transporter [Streptosporangium sp. NBC_01755]|uniref:amino acid transporter n=1 Tax=unclassified Streptosporangium TaxID=2632669 RepID=UPI002DD9F677|nr:MULTISPECIES: amino acid transporter [unclassified Streptosporangium]WSA29407.1 amino acid transporter [Streptosporangium sp. NBC_01810]WSC99149.1 amino acid transporter [Streptosporangium sp. NBC_01755]
MGRSTQKGADSPRTWLLHGLQADRRQIEHDPDKKHSWWQVMCLTGVDYFSTLGYQPGIAALAAGALSPVATLLLVLLTLFGALPVYRRVAEESPNGQGSIAMLEKVAPKWWGKLFVLALLGFAATDFVITMTLSAADATAHILENPFVPDFLDGQRVLVTLVLLGLLGGVFLLGFSEAIGLAVVLVGIYLVLNAIVVTVAVLHVLDSPDLVVDWGHALTTNYTSPLAMVALSMLVMPKLALGLSGFETGVAVMPLVNGDLQARIKGTKRLLTTAALIMSVFLVFSSFATTVLIPHHEFEEGGKASGRALAYLAHLFLGDLFGTVYDVSTIAILWFAGASAMAGLLNLVPRYLPRYGMAPDWTRAVRPLVLVFSVIAFAITIIFDADVEAQGGAYATGVLVLILSAAVAVTISAHRNGRRGARTVFGVIAAVFAYTLVANVIERPDGVKIAFFFIVAVIATSLISRATRSTELRVTEVTLDPLAEEFVNDACGDIHLIANEPHQRNQAEYNDKRREQWLNHRLRSEEPIMFVEVTVVDASEFESELRVHGEERYGHRIFRIESPTVPNSLAAFLLHLRDRTGRVPHIYFHWAEGNPILAMLRYLLFGGGDVPPLTREVLRQAEPDVTRRPHVHVG